MGCRWCQYYLPSVFGFPYTWTPAPWLEHSQLVLWCFQYLRFPLQWRSVCKNRAYKLTRRKTGLELEGSDYSLSNL